MRPVGNPGLTTSVVAAALAVLASGCGLLGGERTGAQPPTDGRAKSAPASATPTDPNDRPAIASVRWSDDPLITMDLIGLNRLGGGQVVAQVRLTNTDVQDQDVSGPHLGSGKTWDYISQVGQLDGYFNGIGLVDGPAHRLLMPYRVGDAGCVCSKTPGGPLEYNEPVTLYAVFPAPSGGATTTTVFTVMGPPFVNVPIGDEVPIPPELPAPEGPEVTPVSYRLAAPTESLDGSQETHDDGEELHVNISTDVLFKINKAQLSRKARAILRGTAGKIDASDDRTVTIEGHADSTGTDAINDPLSRRRANAVKDELSKLVTRSGVRFEAKGYGSRRPLYSNETDEGRRRNRRVTVTFAKPQPAPQEPTPSPAPTTAVPATPGEPGPTTERTIEGQPFTLEVTGLRAIPGDLGVLTYRITNDGDTETWDHRLSRNENDEWMDFEMFHATSVGVIDPAQRIRSRVTRIINEGKGVWCACTPTAGVWLGMGEFQAGQTKDFYAIVALPAGVPPMTVEISEFPALTDVPVTR